MQTPQRASPTSKITVTQYATALRPGAFSAPRVEENLEPGLRPASGLCDASYPGRDSTGAAKQHGKHCRTDQERNAKVGQLVAEAGLRSLGGHPLRISGLDRFD